MEVDFIIIGQGLAGSAVALQLLKRNYKIVVIDDASSNNSSRIAAGLFNPVTGKKMVKTWMCDVIFPYLLQFYSDVESQTGAKFFHPMPLYRPFLSIEEQNEWMGKSADAAFSPYIDTIHTTSAFPGLKDSHGGLLLKQSGYLDTTAYVKSVSELICTQGTLLNKTFDPGQLKIQQGFVEYENITASKIIFCNGVHTIPWFSYLPIGSLKGETIQIKVEITPDVIVNRGIYMVPAKADGHWRVGSTYNFQDKEPHVSQQARDELNAKVRELIDLDFEIESQEWGLRPVTKDRRPMLGAHPAQPQLVIFNGMGTKGVSLAPYFSEVLVHWLEGKGSLNKEVDIKRFNSLYSGSPT